MTIRSVKPSFIIKAVVFSLLVIGVSGQLVDWLFFNQNEADLANAYKQRYQAVILLMEKIEPAELDKLLPALSAQLGTDIEVLSKNDLHIEQDSTSSHDSNIFLTTDWKSELFLYKPFRGGLLKIGPLQQANSHYTSVDFIISISFYILILLVIVFFLMPLILDLDKLSKAAQNYHLNKGLDDLNIKTKSPIYPLTQTFKNLVKTVSDMLRYQSAMHRTVSHELRTPLSRIKFSMALLDKDVLAKQDHQYLETIDQNIDALEKLIDQMLQYSKIENTKGLLKVKSVSPIDVLLRIQQEFDVAALDKNITFTFDHIPDFVKLNADANLLFIAISNVLQNALTHTQDIVKINAYQNNKTLFITIEDNGKGISSNELNTLYLPFAGTKQHADGSKSYGLGMAITKHILDLHNGTIAYDHSEFGGAKFTIMLPLQETN